MKHDPTTLSSAPSEEPTAVNPSEIIGRECEVIVKLPKGKLAKFKSKVGFVSPITQVDDSSIVWVEIENYKENGRWVVQPGQWADVKILLDPPAKPKVDAKPLAAKPAEKPEVKPNP